jgi:site-specific DNA-methyltransferase (adenine-specific)
MIAVNRIIRGECPDALREIPNDVIDLIITSPPYADKRRGNYKGVSSNGYVSWFLPITKELYRILKPAGSFILNIKENCRNGERETYVLELILALKKQGWLWIEEYCWYKKNSYPGKWPNRFRDNWERCLHFTKQKKFKMYQDAVKIPIGDWAKQRFKSLSENDFIRYVSGTNSNFGRNVSNWLNRRKVYPHNVLVFEKEHYIDPTTVLNLATECSNRNHSAVFPIELPSWFIRLFTRKNDVVLDPFGGVGTTALASLLLGRNYIVIEDSEVYVKEAIKNINELKTILEIKG